VAARFTTDPAWPGPVWGSGVPEEYAAADLEEIKARLVEAFTV